MIGKNQKARRVNWGIKWARGESFSPISSHCLRAMERSFSALAFASLSKQGNASAFFVEYIRKKGAA
jgi:hypothetical protein